MFRCNRMTIYLRVATFRHIIRPLELRIPNYCTNLRSTIYQLLVKAINAFTIPQRAYKTHSVPSPNFGDLANDKNLTLFNEANDFVEVLSVARFPSAALSSVGYFSFKFELNEELKV